MVRTFEPFHFAVFLAGIFATRDLPPFDIG